MAQELTLYPAGLITDPNPHSAAPQGALTAAENVVMRRAGQLSPREGTAPLTAPAGIGAGEIHRIFDTNGELLEWAGPASLNTGLFRQSDGAQILSGTGQTLTALAQGAHKTEAARNTYITTTSATRRIVDASAVAPTADYAGVPQGLVPRAQVQTGGPNDWFAADEAVAYRVVFRKLVNGQQLFGAPSGRSDAANAIAAPVAYTEITIPIPVSTTGANGAIGVVAGDVCQVYRSRLSGAANITPSDEMFLALEQEVTAADITAEYLLAKDRTSDENLGASLYTNATQEGILQANTRPPAARDLAYYAGMMFFGGTTSFHRLPCSLLEPEVLRTVVVSGAVVGLGLDYFTIPLGTVDEANLGRYLGNWNLPTGDNGADPTTAGTPNVYPPGTRIGSVDIPNKRYYTVDELGNPVAATSTYAGPNTVELHGAVILTDLSTMSQRAYFTSAVWNPGEDVAGRRFDVPGAPGTPVNAEEVIESLAYIVSRDTARKIDVHPTIGSATEAGFALEERNINFCPDGFTFGYAPAETFSPSSYFGPYLGSNSPATSRQENVQNRLMYSKQLEQEAVPIVNFVDVGSEKANIQRLMETRDSLFIFKEDGLFRISGTGPFNLRLDTIDADLRLVQPKACVQHRNAVYAWTNRGFISVSDSGVRELSQQVIQSEIADTQQALIQNTSGLAASGAFAFASSLHDEVYFGAPASSDLYGALRLYVYSKRTAAFTRWDFAASGNYLCDGLYRKSDGALLLAGYASALLNPALWQGQSIRSDEAYPLTIVTVTSLGADKFEIKAAAFPAGYTPTKGDAWVVGGVDCLVDSFDGALTVIVISTGVPAGVAATAHRAYESLIRFKVKEASNPGALKHWSQVVAVLEDGRRMTDLVLGFSSNVSSARSTVRPSLTYTEATLPRVVRCAPTRNASRAAELFVDVAIAQALSTWRLGGMTLTYNVTSTRVQT